ncbi:MAG TPA: GNAT family N-acetyltransferase [Candidatus Nanoarchaeia archaeon]|nr:GNAT family N-acetyltransferase [Candidatus Nanoarchaeia archaeon]
MTISIRSASVDDILSIKRILSQYILETELVDENIDQFIVAEDGKKIVGCAYLDTSQQIIELRSLAVLPKNKGIGRMLFEYLKAMAESMTDRLYIRTTSRGFFEKMGCTVLDYSQKPVIWQDCAECDKIDVCLQVPMVLELRSC